MNPTQRYPSIMLVALLLFPFASCTMTPDSASSESASAQNVNLIEALGSDAFKIANTDEVLLNAIEIIDVVEFRSRSESTILRVIVTGPTAATDYGVYKRLVLVFNNGYEMPNRTAVFDLGSVGNVNAISQTAADRIQISANLFEVSAQSYPGDITIDVNIAELLAAEAEAESAEDYSDEGTLKSHVVLRIR
jgi:hypothetical protein